MDGLFSGYFVKEGVILAKKIYINPGHSDKDPGAVGYETERRLNVQVSEYQRDYLLENYDCEVRMNPGSMGNLSAIAGDANSWGADLFVSNHFNAGGGDGWEGLVYNDSRVALGKIFEKAVLAAGQNSRGVKLRPDLAVLRLTQMPAVLNEGAFVDNKKDIDDWNEDAELKKLAVAYAKATAEALQLEKKNPQSNVLYRVQVGAYREEANAAATAEKLKAAGFDAMILQVQ